MEMRESARGLARRKLEPRMYVYIFICVCGFMYMYMMSITGSDVYDVQICRLSMCTEMVGDMLMSLMLIVIDSG